MKWLLAFRIKTLTAAVVPVLVGTALTRASGFPIKWELTLYALMSALFIQIGTNLINDALDFTKGADSDSRLGPKRVTQSGLLSPAVVKLAGFVSFLLALMFGVPLVIEGGAPIVVVGILSLACGYLYTGGPCPLAYVGLGDIFVVVFFGIVAVGGVFFLQTHFLNGDSLVAGVQIGFLATVLIAINNLRDAQEDRKVNKRTMAVRFGAKFTRLEILLLFALSFALSTYWIWKGFWLAGALPLLAFPLARHLISDIVKQDPGPIYNQFLARAALIHLMFGIQLSLGLFLAQPRY
jgi:1,4-dihydroxy-2-naphthoate octaprenyltransferase